MKFFGEWIPQSSSKRMIKGFIDGSSEMGFEDTIKYFQINKNGAHKIWGSKVNSRNQFRRGTLEYKNSAKVSKLDGWYSLSLVKSRASCPRLAVCAISSMSLWVGGLAL